MKEKFYRFGGTVGFDFTYNLVRDKPINGKQYSIGAFVGVDNNVRITPFGLAIVSN